MTPAEVRRYLRLMGDCGRILHDLPLANTPELLRGQTKRRATMGARRLMEKSRDLWRLLSRAER